jgi:hypothetical protein
MLEPSQRFSETANGRENGAEITPWSDADQPENQPRSVRTSLAMKCRPLSNTQPNGAG